MGWGQRRWEYYWIPFLRTIHWSKSELKQLRKKKKNRMECVNTLLKAITRSNCWNSNFFSVLETRHPSLSNNTKINSIKIQEGLSICDRNHARKRQNCWCQHTQPSAYKVAIGLTRNPLEVRQASGSVPKAYLTP